MSTRLAATPIVQGSAVAPTAPSILHVVAGSDFGGASVIVAELAASAVRAGLRVSVQTTDERLAAAVRRAGARVVDDIAIERRLRPLRDLWSVVRLVRHLRREQYDVVHTHTSKGGLVGRLAAYVAGVPVVVHTVHGFGFHDGTSRSGKRLAVMAERAMSRITDQVVTVSEHHRALALEERIVPPAKLVAVHNGIADPRAAQTVSLNAQGDSQAPLMIACHGRLSEQKGIVFLLRAISALSPGQRSRCRVQVLGEGELAEELFEEARRLSVDGIVEFLGFRPDAAAIVGRADLVVLPSLWEGLSISLLEALALGRPVIATSIPSNVEVVGNSRCAVLIAPADPAALALAIARLLKSSDERRRLSIAGRQRYEASYGTERMCDSYLDLYRKALSA